jgi:hypothetical protein
VARDPSSQAGYHRAVRFLLVLLVACAPVVDGPAERQRAADHADAARLTAQLAALPGVVRAEVLLLRSISDPLAPTPPTRAAASLVIIVDDRADRAATAAAARALSRTAAPDVDPTILVEVGATRPSLATVGPFTVEASSRTPLKAALAIALGLVLALAGWIAYRERATSRRTR